MLQDPILLVDDDADLRSTLLQALLADGYRVNAVDSAVAALEAVKLHHYPVILTDLNMPGGPSGLELVAAVKARDPRVLCVIFTGYASLDVAIQSVKCGAYDFIRKPFKVTELEAILDRALDHAHLLRQVEGYQRDLEARVLARWEDQKIYHKEVLDLNAILTETLDHPDAKAVLAPFLRFLRHRHRPDGYVVLLPDGNQAWSILEREGGRPWAAFGTLPAPVDLVQIRDWGWIGGYPDGYLVPLRRGDCLMAALFLGFEERSSFHPEEASFELWRKHLEAALYSLLRERPLEILE